MDAVGFHSLSDLITARRLLLKARGAQAEKKGPSQKTRTALEDFREDQAILSGEHPNRACACKEKQSPAASAITINLRDLIQKMRQSLDGNDACPVIQAEAITIEISTTIEESLSIVYDSLEYVDGLVVRSKNLAETDRYRFEFSDATTLTIRDKWSGRSTTIWGDPHVDVSDVAGEWNGDFKDLTASSTHTTFMLLDGTRLTITAEDAGVIEAVDIFKDGQHVRGVGLASQSFNEQNSLFASSVDNASSSTLPMGDVVYAGGDGNDWFNSSQQLVWGATTGPVVDSRPSSYLEFEYNYRVTQKISASLIQVSA
jgi:hypothetical protein